MAHTTNFEKLVHLLVSCGGDILTHFMANTAKNTVHISHIADVEFVEALGTWTYKQYLVKQPKENMKLH